MGVLVRELAPSSSITCRQFVLSERSLSESALKALTRGRSPDDDPPDSNVDGLHVGVLREFNGGL